MPTHIGTNAEPALFFYKFFLLFFFFFYLCGVWWSASIQPINSHPAPPIASGPTGAEAAGEAFVAGTRPSALACRCRLPAPLFFPAFLSP